MLWLVIVGVVLVCGFFLLVIRSRSDSRFVRGSVQTATAKSARAVVRTSAPARTPDTQGAQAQVLRVPDLSRACDAARRQVGHTFDVAASPSLPLPECGRVDCRCRYERIVNRRRQQRRESADRRTEIRFDAKIDRRKNPDRRLRNNFWDLFGPR